MKGRVLGADGQGGTISGQDGKRYKFDLSYWKGERAPSANEEVDFDIDSDGRACDIYPLKSGLSVDFGAVGGQAKALFGNTASSPTGNHLMALVTGNAVFQISLVILLTSFLFSFVKISTAFAPGSTDVLPDHGAYAIFGIGDLIDYLKTSFEAAAASAEQIAKIMGAPANPNPFAPPPPTQDSNLFGNPQKMADSLRTMEALTSLLYLLYLAPLGAVVAIVQLLRRRPAALASFAAGVGCIASFLAFFAWRWLVISGIKSGGNTSAADVAGRAIGFGLGSWIILLCGLALVGAAMGIFKFPERS